MFVRRNPLAAAIDVELYSKGLGIPVIEFALYTPIKQLPVIPVLLALNLIVCIEICLGALCNVK
jgi:hypothetical protein